MKPSSAISLALAALLAFGAAEGRAQRADPATAREREGTEREGTEATDGESRDAQGTDARESGPTPSDPFRQRAPLLDRNPDDPASGRTASIRTDSPDTLRRNHLDVGVRNTVTYTNNINRGGSGSEIKGWIGEVSPYAIGSYRGAYARGDLYFALRSFFRTENGNSVAKPDLNATGERALIGDWLWLGAAAKVYAFSPLAFDVLNVDPAVYGQNVAQFRQFALSPSIRGKFGSTLTYRTSFTSVYTTTSVGNLLAKFDHRLRAELASGPAFTDWTWDASAEQQRRRFESGLELDRTSARATLYRVFSPQFRLGGTLAYEHIEGLTNSSGEDRGAGGGISLDWLPTRRTSFSAAWIRQYYGSDIRTSFTHRFGRLAAGLSYQRNVVSSSDASVLLFDPGALYSTGGYSADLNPVFQTLLNQDLLRSYGIPASAGLLSDGVVRNRTLTGSLGYTASRNTLVFNLYRSNRTSLISTQSGGSGGIAAVVGLLEQTGINANWRYKLTPTSYTLLSAQRIRIRAPNTGDQSTLTSISASYNLKLTASTTAGLGVVRSRQNGQGISVVSYDETAVFGMLDTRF